MFGANGFYRNTPTSDLYFFRSLKGLISQVKLFDRFYPIRRLGPNCFVAKDKAVIIRYATESELKAIKKMHMVKCYYLIDDALHGLMSDVSLPEDYREKLVRFQQDIVPEILAIADVVIAPNERILAEYPDKPGMILEPSAIFIETDFSHFDNRSRTNILFSGTRSHQKDFDFLAYQLAELLGRRDDIHLTTFLGRQAPDVLKGFKNIDHRRPCSWEKYKKILRTERYHIAFCPYLDTPFNQARSINKLHDHAAFGAAGLYSNTYPLDAKIENNINGCLLENDAELWCQKIEKLADNVDMNKIIAQNGGKLAKITGSHENVCNFWERELDLKK